MVYKLLLRATSRSAFLARAPPTFWVKEARGHRIKRSKCKMKMRKNGL